jgi:hypothetical protein
VPIAFRIQTPWSPAGERALGAIAVVQLHADTASELEGLLERLEVPRVAPGAVALAPLAGVDRGLVARFSPTLAHLTPHGSPLLLDALAERLRALNVRDAPADDPRALYPEAGSLAEAAALSAIAAAPSPMALDLVLEHRDRWLADPRARPDPALAPLDRLLRPPTVALAGAPNIGKSSLVNALARRRVSIVHDEPGVTRDHVGVTVVLDGLAVHLLDTPGLRPAADPIEREAIELARAAIEAADLVLLARDPLTPPPDLGALGVRPRGPVVPITLRADLATDGGGGAGPLPEPRTSALEGRGLADLAAAVREALIPRAVLDAESPWAYHPALIDGPSPAAPGG